MIKNTNTANNANIIVLYYYEYFLHLSYCINLEK